ncbi:MAG: cobaltochelatase subunit CobN [Edaphobacter sp.]|uniref:cobaltochelatase subunit CobN n=1 Tax=Edaphobacter sp. TaxID=1934404 RepID=UPI00238390E0|nr:cobaltochelatase subunit CobN [Edaphobacter sp.]MDE1178210.1 cobaltochelatase subunit CobN [Edaphobacter sp.]
MKNFIKSSIVMLLTVSGIAIAQQEKPNVVIVLHSSQTLPAAMDRFQTMVGRDACICSVLREEDMTPERLKQAKVVFMQHPSQEMLDNLKPVALEAMKNGLQVATDVPEFIVRNWSVEPTMRLTTRLMPYWNNGGEDNMLSFLLVLYSAAGGKGISIPPPVRMANKGVYHPDAPHLFPTMAEYLAWYRKSKPNQGRLVTVNFFYTYLKDNDTAVVDSLIRELEHQGMAAAGIVGSPHSSLVSVFNQPADDPIRVMMMFTLALAKPDDRAMLERQNIHVMNLMLSRQTRSEWEATDRGVTPDRITTMLSSPEAYGATEPMMIGTTEGGAKGVPSHLEPIPERVHAAALRAKRWVTLAEKSNADKRLAVIYYNNPPGKGNIGASYMNLPPSIQGVLQTLKDAGYQTGAIIPDTDEILKLLSTVGHNVENWEPGELDRMARSGKVALVPVTEYEKWFAELPEPFQKNVLERWGQPRDAKLMTWTNSAGRKYFVIPGVQLGNVFLGPQVLRASAEEYTNVQHSATLPPHHGYIASFLYYRNILKVDAMIQMGRHGTLEWLPGKNAGQAGWDTSEVLLGDLPNINYYIMDGDAEAIQARRRGAAVLISHLTPILSRSGFEERFGVLNEALSRWQETHETAPALSAEYAKQAVGEMDRLGLVKQLSLDVANTDETMEKAIAFLDSVEETPMPLGLATVGQMPSEGRLRIGLKTFLASGFLPDESKIVAPYLQGWGDAIFDSREIEAPSVFPDKLRDKVSRSLAEGKTWIANMRISPARELDELPKVLRGEYLPSGPVGDPLNVPEALPTGRNLNQGDPNLLPTRAAWALGKRMGDELLERYKKQHGTYPDHISMVLWQGESGRNQGAMEAEALYLMGVQPEWNNRNVVDRLSLVPDTQMTHPRVNVLFTASGLYRDGMAEKIIMLDRAARIAASAGDNALSRQNQDVKKALMSKGMSDAEAEDAAGARVFSSAPGSYGTGLSNMVEQSRDIEEHATMAELYLSKTNYAYTEKSWGAHVPKLLEHQLKGNQVVMHSRSSNLYGAVDNDDVYQAMGGLRLASEVAGAKPDLVINNLRHAGHEKVEGARDFIATELNARNWNPQWIKEMQKEGYSGAREMVRAGEFLYGWKATAPETVAPEVWQKMYDVYVKDEYSLGLKPFMEKVNPAARQAMLGRLLEIDRQGTYKFKAAERQQMIKEYAQNVAKNGLACDPNTCGNQKLKQEIAQQVARAPQLQLTRDEQQAFRKTEIRTTHIPKPSPATPLKSESHRASLPPSLNGYRVTYVKMGKLLQTSRQVVAEHFTAFILVWLVSIASGVLLGIVRRRWIKQQMIQLLPR